MSKTYEQLNRAMRLMQQDDLAGAERHIKRLLRSHPNHADGLHIYGAILATRNDLPNAIKYFEKALAVNPNNSRLHFNLGSALEQSGDKSTALNHFVKACTLEPNFAPAWASAANLHHQSRRFEDALQHYEKALALNDRDAAIWANYGITLTSLHRYNDALAAQDRAIALGETNNAFLWDNRATTLTLMKRYDEAYQSYKHALTLAPHIDWTFSNWLRSKMLLCDWQDIEHAFSEFADRITNGEKHSPFVAITTPLSNRDLLRCAQNYFTGLTLPNVNSPPSNHSADNKITLGYFSADFHNHATTYLMAGLLEQHDKSRFKIIAFSFGPSQHDEMRQRIAAACDQFIDVNGDSDEEIAALSRSLGVDIAIDLKGFTTDHRVGIFVRRAAPLQVSYLGFPGTMGAKLMDYLIADRTLIQEAARPYYSEHIVYMPNSYQINDNKRAIAAKEYQRSEVGLPDKGFVFCCFNNSYKITPDAFDVWMRLLKRIPASVLWLLHDHPATKANLHKEAHKRGVECERIIFADRYSVDHHLARHRCADLFLDTFYYNAHTTASDALWAGIPIVTRLGETFASRVAASLLTAVGIPELITNSTEEYENLAYELATNPEILRQLRSTLASNRLNSTLFDTALFTRHLEKAYSQMVERHLNGLPPQDMHVY